MNRKRPPIVREEAHLQTRIVQQLPAMSSSFSDPIFSKVGSTVNLLSHTEKVERTISYFHSGGTSVVVADNKVESSNSSSTTNNDANATPPTAVTYKSVLIEGPVVRSSTPFISVNWTVVSKRTTSSSHNATTSPVLTTKVCRDFD